MKCCGCEEEATGLTISDDDGHLGSVPSHKRYKWVLHTNNIMKDPAYLHWQPFFLSPSLKRRRKQARLTKFPLHEFVIAKTFFLSFVSRSENSQEQTC